MSSRPIMRAAAGVLLLGFAFAACAQSRSSGDAPLVANAADSTFMTHAAADGMAEVRMGQLALQKSSNAAVKQLAQRIVDDHTDANEKLRILAQDREATLPSAPTAEAQQSAQTMADMDGAKFDQAWANHMVMDHQKAIALFNDEARQTRDTDLRAFAEKTLPVLNTHLQMAQKLHGQLGMPEARDQAMAHGGAMESGFAHTSPTDATTADKPAASPSTPAASHGSQR